MQNIKVPHVFILLTAIIFVCSLATYIIPSGKYKRESQKVGELNKTLVVPGTYHKIPKEYTVKGIIFKEDIPNKSTPVSFMSFITAIPRGMEKASDIIFFIFIIGGVFGVLQRTGTITAFIQKLLSLLGDKPNILVIVLMVTIGIAASTLGMGEEFVPLIPLFLIISKELGYDRIFGVAIVWLAGEIGFAAATTNPYTVQIAQNLSQVPLNSGITFRVIFFAVSMSFGIWYLLRYAKKLKENPKKSIMHDDNFEISNLSFKQIDFNKKHLAIILTVVILFSLIIFAVQTYGWWINEMSGAFLLLGFVSYLISDLNLKEATDAFIKGMEEMVVAAFVVGFARAVQVVLQDGQILDTLIYSTSNVLTVFPKFLSAGGMLVFQTVINFFIPSGSGQAAVTMPIMAPLSDLLGITRQTAIFAFTCGDGFANMVIPTSGLLMAVLGLAKVPFTKWLKFILPIFSIMMLLSFIFIIIAVYINY